MKTFEKADNLMTTKGFRIHIAILGRRNVGKSSILNAITKQNVSIVSDVAGTTTDPVEKPMEILPIGPVLFIDTAGIDDEGCLGELRIQKTRKAIDRIDIGIIVTDYSVWGEFENNLLDSILDVGASFIVAINKSDIQEPSQLFIDLIRDTIEKSLKEKNKKDISYKILTCSCKRKETEIDLIQAMIDIIPDDLMNQDRILNDIVSEKDISVLVVPIDKEAPKGRIILPQVQTIRNILDIHSSCILVQLEQLQYVLSIMNIDPKIVITDSQCFKEVARIAPCHIPMTSFSILFSRLKGDLCTQILGVKIIDSLSSGDKILIAEACTHHPIQDDIGREKIPKMIKKYTGIENLVFDIVRGFDFPIDKLSEYRLVIQCGSCMWNRRAVLSRINTCNRNGISISNYGIIIAYINGILERACSMYPECKHVFSQ